MMKDEFEKISGIEVSVEDYKEIEFVYMFHPAISDTKGKIQIAEIYKNGGMLVIRAMKDMAERGKDIDHEIGRLEKELAFQKKRYEMLKSGDDKLERCLDATEKIFDSSNSEAEYNEICAGLVNDFPLDMIQKCKNYWR